MIATLLPAHKPSFAKGLDTSFADRIQTIDDINMSVNAMTCEYKILDILDYAYSISSAGLDENERRKLITTAFELHKYKGTVYALKLALSAIFDEYEVEELGNYIFRVKINFIGDDFDSMRDKALIAITQAKNARSHFEGFNIVTDPMVGNIKVLSSTKFRI